MPDIEDQIQKAIQEGKFNNLPGKGKPLRLDDDTHVDPEWRLAHHLLKSSGFILPWIESRQEILAGIETARMDLERAWRSREKAMAGLQPYQAVEVEWQRAVTNFAEQVQAINKKILAFNLDAPSAQFQLVPLNLEREIATATGISG